VTYPDFGEGVIGIANVSDQSIGSIDKDILPRAPRELPSD
jgi:hypothetical protein